MRIKVLWAAGLNSEWSEAGARSLVGQTTRVEGVPATVVDAKVDDDPRYAQVTLEGELDCLLGLGIR